MLPKMLWPTQLDVQVAAGEHRREPLQQRLARLASQPTWRLREQLVDRRGRASHLWIRAATPGRDHKQLAGRAPPFGQERLQVGQLSGI
jgi:hypothetical protein